MAVEGEVALVVVLVVVLVLAVVVMLLLVDNDSMGCRVAVVAVVADNGGGAWLVWMVV